MIFRGHRVKNEKKTISNCGGTAWRWRRWCDSVAVQRDRNISNRLPRRPHTNPRCPMVIRYFFPNVHANTPFTYPLLIATEFTLSLGMKIRVVATRPFGVTFMRNWVIRWKQLSVLKRKRRYRAAASDDISLDCSIRTVRFPKETVLLTIIIIIIHFNQSNLYNILCIITMVKVQGWIQRGGCLSEHPFVEHLHLPTYIIQ